MFNKLAIIFLLGMVFPALTVFSSKISDSLLKALDKKDEVNIIISFKQETQPILDQVNAIKFQSRGDKIAFMKAQLESLAKESQENVLTILRSKSDVKFQSFWINNKVFVRGASRQLIESIADFPEVNEIREEIIQDLNESQQQAIQIPINSKQEDLGWNLAKIEVEEAWNLIGENKGEGVVVASIDTGVRYLHEALQSSYRTSYGWYDPFVRTPSPNDESYVGTHAMGVIVGSHGIGIAPSAKWIACKGCNRGCAEAELLSCGQWVLCPTLWNGNQPDCSKAPNIVNSEGASRQFTNFYAAVVNAWRAADIIPIFALGTLLEGRTCETAMSPGDYENVIGVSATMNNDVIAYFSTRGPSLDGRIKPDLSAPGLNLPSACSGSNTEYCLNSGTNLAAAHVSGTVALLLARNQSLTYDQIKNLLQNNAEREMVGFSPACGGIDYTTWPNNIYGYGRLNARRAVAALIEGSF